MTPCLGLTEHTTHCAARAISVVCWTMMWHGTFRQPTVADSLTVHNYNRSLEVYTITITVGSLRVHCLQHSSNSCVLYFFNFCETLIFRSCWTNSVSFNASKSLPRMSIVIVNTPGHAHSQVRVRDTPIAAQ